MFWLFVGHTGVYCRISFVVISFIYYRVLIFALPPCYILIYDLYVLGDDALIS